MTPNPAFIAYFVHNPSAKCIARRIALMAMAVTSMVSLPIPSAHAQAAPAWMANRPIRMIVPFPAGGGADVVARIIATAVGSKLGEPIIVDNKAGAGGAIGTEFVYNAPGDGYTIQMASVDNLSIYPNLYAKARYKGLEFTPVSPIVKINFVLMGRPGLAVKTVSDIVALSKQKQLSYSTYGVGSVSHVAMLKLISLAKLAPMTDVPYKGTGPAAQALLASEVDLMMVPAPLAVSYRSRLTMVGIAAPERSDALKDVPTLSEQGINIDTSAWIGIVAPPKLPAAIADSMSKRFAEVMADPEVQKRLTDQAMTPHIGTRQQFGNYLNDQYKLWGDVVRGANIKLED